MEADKKFIILGNVNAITYKEVFPLLKDNKLWLGYSIHSGDRKFNVPDDYPLEAANCGIDSDGKKFIRVKGVRWFTNIDHGKRHEWLKLDTMAHNLKFNKKLRKKLEKNFGTIAYPNYDNYDAIEVPFTECIPSDYDGVMGVPITFMDKYNPEQFEIIWQATGNSYANAPKNILTELKFDPSVKYGGGLGTAVVNGKACYSRILIRAKNNDINKDVNEQ